MTVVGTLVGAAIGHSASHRSAERVRYAGGRSRPVERCETWYETETRRTIDVYRVTYRYAGRHYQTETTRRPGKRIRVHVNVTPA